MNTDKISVTYTMSIRERVKAQEKIKDAVIKEKVKGYFLVNTFGVFVVATGCVAGFATLITFWIAYNLMENKIAIYISVGAFIVLFFINGIHKELLESYMNKNESKEKAYAKYAVTVTVHPDFICQGNDKYEA